MKRRGWREQELESRPKGDPEEVRIALRLRRETTMTLAWIAQALRLGTKTYLSDLRYWQRKEKKQKRCAI